MSSEGRFSLKSLIGGTPSPSPSTETKGPTNPAAAAIRGELSAGELRSKLWTPQEGPQTKAFESPATITCYGGAAGGGKSSFGVGTILREHHRATIFRREGNQHKDLIDHAKELTEGYRTGFNGTTNVLSLPRGSFIEFAGLKEPDDWMKWKGRRRDCWMFDEATECLRSQVFSLFGWLGSTIPGQRLRIILTFNPPSTPEGEWINELLEPWLDMEHSQHAEDGDIRYFVSVGDPKRPDSNRVEWVEGPEPVEIEREDGTSETLIPMSITFIRAKVTDNKFLSGDDDYIRSLMALPEPLRSQALYGLWDAGKNEDPYQVIPTAWVVAAQARWKPKSVLLASGQLAPRSALGGDIAHGGDDRTVLADRYADWIDQLEIYEGKETPDGEAAAIKIHARLQLDTESPQRMVNIDALGYGANCLTHLAGELGVRGIQSILAQDKSTWIPPGPDGLIPKEGTPGRLKMRNLRAEMYWRLRLALDPERGATLAIPPGKDILRDLCAARYDILTGSVVKIESKDEIKKRLGRSPDLADAVALSMLPRIASASKGTAAIPTVGGANRSGTPRQAGRGGFSFTGGRRQR